MNDLVRRDTRGSDRRRCGVGKLNEVRFEPSLDSRGAGEEYLHRFNHTFGKTRRPSDQQAARATRKLSVEHEERDAPEVISVEVRDEDRVNVFGIDACSLECDQRRSSAVDETAGGFGLQENASLKAVPASECVTTSEESHSHQSPVAPIWRQTDGR
jgi:hypothetical protein